MCGSNSNIRHCIQFGDAGAARKARSFLSCAVIMRMALGSPLAARGRKEKEISQRYAGPQFFVGRGGSPVFAPFLRPPMRGGWRAERRMLRISPERPGGSARATLAGLTHHTDASASPDAPSRYRSAFAFTAAGRCGACSTPQRLLRLAARGRGYDSRPQVSHPVPVLRRPAENAPRLERDGLSYR